MAKHQNSKILLSLLLIMMPHISMNITPEMKERLKAISKTSQFMTPHVPKNIAPEMKKELQASEEVRETSQLYLNHIKDAVNKSEKDLDVKLVTFIGDFLSKLPISPAAKKIFNNKLAMRNMQVITDIPKYKYIRTGLGVTGSMAIRDIRVRATLYVFIDSNFKPQYSLSLELPEHYKLSALFPALKKLDKLSLPKINLILTSMRYATKNGYFLYEGLNLISTLELSGPLKVIEALKRQAKKHDAVIVEDEPIQLRGVIARDINESWFSAVLPIRIGVDLTQIKQVPKSVTNVFKAITTDNLEFMLLFPKAEFTIETGIRLILGTQRNPIRLTAFGTIEPTGRKFSLGMHMRNELELKWISFGNGAIQVDFDADTMPITSFFGIPFTGLWFFGNIGVGKGASRAHFEATAGLSLTEDEDKIPPLIFELDASNIRFEHIIELLLEMARKKKGVSPSFPSDKIPTFHINRARGYLATENTWLTNRYYYAGIGLSFDAEIFNQKVKYDLDIFHKELRMDGIAYLSNIIIKNKKGKPIFELTGPGIDQKENTADDGPISFCSFDIKYPVAAAFGVRGMLKIPPLGIRSKTDLVLTGKSFKADLETEFPGFTGLFKINVDPLKIKETSIEIGFKKGFDRFLLSILDAQFKRLQKKATIRLDEINENIRSFAKKAGATARKLWEESGEDIEKVEKEIGQLQEQYAALTQDLGVARGRVQSAPFGEEKRGERKEKRSIRQERRKIGAEIVKKEAYLMLVLKPEHAIVPGTVETTQRGAMTLAEARIAKRIVTTTLNVVNRAIQEIAKGIRPLKVDEVFGSYSMKDMLAGKLPKLDSLKIRLQFPGIRSRIVSFKDIQFDFTHPLKSGIEITKKIMKEMRLKLR